MSPSSHPQQPPHPLHGLFLLNCWHNFILRLLLMKFSSPRVSFLSRQSVLSVRITWGPFVGGWLEEAFILTQRAELPPLETQQCFRSQSARPGSQNSFTISSFFKAQHSTVLNLLDRFTWQCYNLPNWLFKILVSLAYRLKIQISSNF